MFLHFMLDLWIHRRRRRRACGRIVLVRYADDFLASFASEADAQEMLLALRARLAASA
ncbi:hypothetical protein RX330_11530 [Bradyrhizobium sp. NDS-1]|uniref:hypothetical protein n=1 Tax=Bradyrhizobium sp. NDS-1 TaxID=3080014 RepID=UPI00293E24E9|nr:hypothetical protein [Bradyrhizobium sp. NDS-1]WOH75666.1 hypothetical protein RX330_11530 [Bradyrhizobium sp. NDS-1]